MWVRPISLAFLQLLPLESPLPIDVLVVLAVVAVTLALFVLQPVPIDATAIALMVALILLGQWTGVSPEEGVSGFSNPATLTVLAMFVLSEGVRQTGVIQILTRKMESFAGDSETRQLLAVVGLAGPPAGFVNNTPIVAVLIPAVTNLARKTIRRRRSCSCRSRSPRCSVEHSPSSGPRRTSSPATSGRRWAGRTHSRSRSSSSHNSA